MSEQTHKPETITIHHDVLNAETKVIHNESKHPEPAQKPSIGRIVHFVLDGGPHKGEHRPAIITKMWPNYNDREHVQLQVFTDGPNDGEAYKSGLFWATSVTYADASENKPYSWHWPEKV